MIFLPRMTLPALLLAATVAGCGQNAAIGPGPSRGAKSVAATAEDPRAAAVKALGQFVYLRHPHSATGISNPQWHELSRTDQPEVVLFNVTAQLDTADPLPEKTVEFYGQLNRVTGKLVPATLWVGTNSEATFRWLAPAEILR